MMKFASLSRITSGNFLLMRNGIYQVRHTFKYSTNAKKKIEGDEFDVPIKFSTSRAATAPVAHTLGRAINVPWYQGLVISISVGIFLLYFCVFREENDIDELITSGMTPEVQRSLYGTIIQDDKGKHFKKPM